MNGHRDKETFLLDFAFKVGLVTTQLVTGLMLAALLARRRGRDEPAVRSE